MKALRKAITRSADVIAFVIILLLLGGYILFGMLIVEEDKDIKGIKDEISRLEKKIVAKPSELPGVKSFDLTGRWDTPKTPSWDKDYDHVIYKPPKGRVRVIIRRPIKKLAKPLLELEKKFGCVTIKWEYPKGEDVEEPLEFEILRSDVGGIYTAIGKVPIDKEYVFHDTDVKPKTLYFYKVRVIGKFENLDSDSRSIRTPGIFEILYAGMGGGKFRVWVKKYIRTGDEDEGWYAQQFILENKRGFPVGKKEVWVQLKSGKRVKEDFRTGYFVENLRDGFERIDKYLMHTPKYDGEGRHLGCDKKEITRAIRTVRLEFKDEHGNSLVVWKDPPPKKGEELPCTYCTRKEITPRH
jgi:hypothetical protein